jgi:hypothetical protein
MPADAALPTPARLRSHRPLSLSGDEVAAILWVSAKEALIMAFMVGLLGGIAISILSGICGQMTPSPPPGLNGHGDGASAAWHAARNAIHHHSFVLLFLCLFAAKSTLRLAPYSNDTRWRRIAARVLWITHRISRDWFGLLIKNAFAAFVGVLVWQFAQQFSWTQLLWNVALGLFHPVIEAFERMIGWSGEGLLGRWLSWYGDNQTKFAFWLLYSAGICDDLGLPNYKTLARWAWRRARKILPQPPSQNKAQPQKD